MANKQTTETKYVAKKLGGPQCHLISVPSYISVCGTDRGQYDCSRNGKVTKCISCGSVVTNSNWNTEFCKALNNSQNNTKQSVLKDHACSGNKSIQDNNPKHVFQQRRRFVEIPYKLSAALDMIEKLTIAAAGEIALGTNDNTNQRTLAKIFAKAERDHKRTTEILKTLQENIAKIKGLEKISDGTLVSDDNDEESQADEHEVESENNE